MQYIRLKLGRAPQGFQISATFAEVTLLAIVTFHNPAYLVSTSVQYMQFFCSLAKNVL